MKSLACLPILVLLAGSAGPDGQLPAAWTPVAQTPSRSEPAKKAPAKKAPDVQSPEDRERAMYAAQTADIRRRAAEEAEARATDLEAVAERLELLASNAAVAAKEARDKARDARKAAQAARRRSNEAGAALRRARGTVDENGVPVAPAPSGTGGPGAAKPEPVRRGPALESDKHAAAKRTASQNKEIYLPRTRGSRALPGGREVVVDSLNFDPGEAPDIGDMEVRAKSLWAINVARGSAEFQGAGAGRASKTGHVDFARLTIRPDDDSPGSRGMNWGLRRYNLGDTTVTDCDFIGIPNQHGIYDSLAGHGLYRGNTFENLGGQAIQLVYRDKLFPTALEDNLPYTGKPIVVLEGNHAVDCGRNWTHSGFSWTFFDIGTHEFPSTIVVRDCTVVAAWDFARTDEGARVGLDHPGGIRAPGGLVVHQYQHVRPGARTHTVASFTMDNCLFDMTKSHMPVMALRCVGSILIEDSCFIARDHRRPEVLVDDLPDRRSGTVVIENCVSPPDALVWLSIRNERVVPMHCPGKRLTIDVATLEVVESEVQDDPITRLVSPLSGRTVHSGMTPQPLGHVDDLGTVPVTLSGSSRRAGARRGEARRDDSR